jgi:metal-dependent amidase/aminoacylase/carboxypeptidase family protein
LASPRPASCDSRSRRRGAQSDRLRPHRGLEFAGEGLLLLAPLRHADSLDVRLHGFCDRLEAELRPSCGVAIGAAYAVKQAMQRFNIPGSVAISFGPAEEQIVSRPFLVRAGLYGNADVALILHIGESFAAGYGLMNYAAISAKFDFHGKTAHGAVDPWNGKDAVDAVELMDIGFDKLREHLHPTYRAHRAITAGGVQPNIIADYGQIWWFVRDADMPSAKETFDKLVKIAEGAALMTGTTMDYKIDRHGCCGLPYGRAHR